MTHNLYNENPAMGCRGCMNAVNGISCYIDGTLESEGHIGSPEVIIDCLRKGYHVQPLLPQEIGRFLASVSAQHHQTFQF